MARFPQLLYYRNDALPLLIEGNRRSSRSRRFAADVDDVGTFFNHLSCLSERRIRAKELAAVRERVGRDVEDSHDEAAPRKVELPAADLPQRFTHTGETAKRSKLFER